MMAKLEELIVRRICNGTVIDHIAAGQALNVLKILGVRGGEKYTVAIVMHVASKSLGKKDIVKIEGRELAAHEVDRIALLASQATINTIRNYRVAKKVNVKLPEEIKGLLKCTNPACISNERREPIVPSFKVATRTPTLLVCEYCGTYIAHEEVVSQYTVTKG
jgi:aspartate carbamoyltransferase regulatory subunit